MKFLSRYLTFVFAILFFHLVQADTSAQQLNSTLKPAVGNFTAIAIKGNFVVNVKVGFPKAIMIAGPSISIPKLKSTIENDTLYISGNFPSPLTVNISVPQLNSLSLDGSNVVNVANLKDNFALAAKGNNQINLSGHVKHFVSSLSGNNTLHSASLVTDSTSSVTSGNTHAEIHTSTNISVNAGSQ